VLNELIGRARGAEETWQRRSRPSRATGEHGEVVGAIVLIGISGAMAMNWL
jgi:hypothetical protein